MYLKKGPFQELILLSLNVGTTRLDNLLSSLSIFSKEEIIKALVDLHNERVISFDLNNRIILMTQKMHDVISFLSTSKIVEFFNTGYTSPYLKDLINQMRLSNDDLNYNTDILVMINNCLSFIYKTDFSNELSLLKLNTKKKDEDLK